MTVTVETFCAEFPASSVAVNGTAVVPAANTSGALVVIAGAASTASVAFAPLRNAAITGSLAGTPSGLEVVTVMGSGTETVGAVVSRTMTGNEAVTGSSSTSSSTIVQVTVVSPSAKRDPDGGEHVYFAGLPFGFVAVTSSLNSTFAPLALVASAMTSSGTIRLGGIAAAAPETRMSAISSEIVTRRGAGRTVTLLVRVAIT